MRLRRSPPPPTPGPPQHHRSPRSHWKSGVGGVVTGSQVFSFGKGERGNMQPRSNGLRQRREPWAALPAGIEYTATLGP